MKKCSKCKKWKEYTHFSKSKKSKDGYSYWCKQCTSNYHLKKPKIYVEYKICNKCNKEKHRSEFYTHIATKDGLDNRCKQCFKENNKERKKEYNKKYWKLNKDKLIKYNRKYYNENKEKCIENSLKNYFDNKEHRLTQIKKYSKKNKEEILKKKKEHNNSRIKYDNHKKYIKEIKIYEEIKKSDDNYLMCKCAYCGNWFKPKIKQVKARLAAIYGKITDGTESRLYCSFKCKQACPTYGQIKYFKDQKPATSREVQPELRQMVFERDNWTCQKCNTYKDNLEIPIHCHHIDPVSQNPIESADVDNCITLCKDCHKEVHQLPDCGYAELRCA